MTDLSPDELAALIRAGSRFVVSTHVRPEGDALGSQLALAALLGAGGKTVSLVNRDPVPETFRFLPGWDRIEVSDRISGPFDFWVIVDCPGPERTGLSWEGDVSDRVVVIDHHPREEKEPGGRIWSDPGAAAAGLMIARLARAMGAEIDSQTATLLYAAIMTDTGSFRYLNTSPEALAEASLLVAAGAEPWGVAQALFENDSAARLRLLAGALGTLSLGADGTVAWVDVSKKVLDAAGAGPADSEGFANYPRSIRGVEVGISFEEIGPDSVRVSLRSRGRVNVAEVAAAFGGGGHAAAAGATVAGPAEAVRARVLGAVFEAVRKAEGRDGQSSIVNG